MKLKLEDFEICCILTIVIFRDFFQRQIALSSMVWTCSITGKTGLTFEEALDSEKNAQVSKIYRLQGQQFFTHSFLQINICYPE